MAATLSFAFQDPFARAMTDKYCFNDVDADENAGDDKRGRQKLVPPLYLPKNRSTGNLALAADTPIDRSRYRMSFEGPSPGASTDYDGLAR